MTSDVQGPMEAERLAASEIIRQAWRTNTITADETEAVMNGALSSIEVKKHRNDDLLDAIAAYRLIVARDAERARLVAENQTLREALLDIAARTELVVASGLGGIGADVYAMAKIALASTQTEEK